jgi:ketosteroid isomerase-like protein
VFAYGNYSGIYKATGLPMNARVAHLWTLADGKVTHFEQFVDSHTVQLAIAGQ